MKKSKVIIPAMALLLFSTAASITGTVAWFTATRVFTTSASTFAVNSIDGNLKANVWGRVGTEAITDELDQNNKPVLAEKTAGVSNGTKVRNKTVAASGNVHAKEARLTHGSFNHTDTTGWIVDTDYDDNAHFTSLGTERASYVAETDDNAAARGSWYRKTVSETVGTGNDAVTTDYEYFIAFSWEINFEYSFAGDEGKVGIFLDTDATTMMIENLVTVANDTRTILTGNGFRIAMYPVNVTETNNEESEAVLETNNPAARILGKTASGDQVPDAAGGNTYTPHYVVDATHGDGNYSVPTSVPTNDVVWGDGNYMIPTADGASKRQSEGIDEDDADDVADKVCYIEKPNNAQTGTARLICVAWYEGTSPYIVTNDATAMQKVTTALTFYARAVTTA